MRSEGTTFDPIVPTVPTTKAKAARSPVPRSVGGRWLSLALGTVQAFVALAALSALVPAGLAIGTLLGAIPTFLRRWPAGEMAVALGTFLTLWMVAQILWLGLLSPLQPLLVWAGLAEMGMGLALRQVLPSRRG